MEDQRATATAQPRRCLSCGDLAGQTVEQRAATILDHLITNATIVVTDTGRGGHDLELHSEDGRREAVEVTEATSERMRAAHAAYDQWLPDAHFGDSSARS